METTQPAALTVTNTTKVFSGEYKVTLSDGSTYLVCKVDGQRGWRLFYPFVKECSFDTPDFGAFDGSEWSWSDDFDSKKQTVAWLCS